MFGRATITLGIGPHSSCFYFNVLTSMVLAFSALTLLVRCQEERLACKKLSYEVICLEQGANDLHMIS